MLLLPDVVFLQFGCPNVISMVLLLGATTIGKLNGFACLELLAVLSVVGFWGPVTQGPPLFGVHFLYAFFMQV